MAPLCKQSAYGVPLCLLSVCPLQFACFPPSIWNVEKGSANECIWPKIKYLFHGPVLLLVLSSIQFNGVLYILDFTCAVDPIFISMLYLLSSDPIR
jgi:hypothetical protein